ncbi:hypothetical protein D5018_20480 [Parashewanella curva]|uniref:Uncharacterized protein n=1 Tax=Parashewanella curva TaxID=2338552 RepID=A0A3L8PRI0_9GAMM|nr:hypothetical protein [Parashewanella curva]RLV57824.1 hypothetical protein D5018_20480 [Parashewanella curva]
MLQFTLTRVIDGNTFLAENRSLKKRSKFSTWKRKLEQVYCFKSDKQELYLLVCVFGLTQKPVHQLYRFTEQRYSPSNSRATIRLNSLEGLRSIETQNLNAKVQDENEGKLNIVSSNKNQLPRASKDSPDFSINHRIISSRDTFFDVLSSQLGIGNPDRLSKMIQTEIVHGVETNALIYCLTSLQSESISQLKKISHSIEPSYDSCSKLEISTEQFAKFLVEAIVNQIINKNKSVCRLAKSTHLIELTHGSVTYSDSKLGFAPDENFSDKDYILKASFDKERQFEHQSEYRFLIDFNQTQLPEIITKRLIKPELFHSIHINQSEILTLPIDNDFFTKIY